MNEGATPGGVERRAYRRQRQRKQFQPEQRKDGRQKSDEEPVLSGEGFDSGKERSGLRSQWIVWLKRQF